MNENPVKEVGVFCDEHARTPDGFLPELGVGEAHAELSGVQDAPGAPLPKIHGQVLVNQQVHAAASVTERTAPRRRA